MASISELGRAATEQRATAKSASIIFCEIDGEMRVSGDKRTERRSKMSGEEQSVIMGHT